MAIEGLFCPPVYWRKLWHTSLPMGIATAPDWVLPRSDTCVRVRARAVAAVASNAAAKRRAHQALSVKPRHCPVRVSAPRASARGCGSRRPPTSVRPRGGTRNVRRDGTTGSSLQTYDNERSDPLPIGIVTPNAEFTGASLLRVRWDDVLCG